MQSDTRHAAAWTRALRAGAPTTALLVSDPTSAHHPFDVAVYVADEYVGDLQGDDLLDYGTALAALRTTGVEADAYGTARALDIALPAPGAVAPANPIPAGVVLPHGAPLGVQRTGGTTAPEAEQALDRYARAGQDVWLAVTLRTVRPPRGGAARDVEVLLDEAVIGRLDPHEATDLTPLLTYLGDRDVVPVAAAVLRGSSLHRSLTLSCLRAQDADEDWLRAVDG